MMDEMIQTDIAAVIQPRIVQKPNSWLAKIEFINHLILFNNVLITVLSEKEGGKTSFGNLLLDNLDQQIKSVSMKVKAPCNREYIINDIAAQLHLNHDAHTDMTSLVTQINERKAHVVLMIDDAQHLPETLIKEAMLAIKNQENFGFFHLCLISDYSIVATLNGLSASFFDNLIHTIELGSMTEHEARTYVLQRAMAAHLITRPLTDLQLKQFYQLTKGNVAKINSNLESFIFKCSTQEKNAPYEVVKKAGMALSIAFLAGLSSFYMAKTYYSIKTEKEATVAAITQQQEALESQIPSWEHSSTRQLVYASMPKKQVLDELDEENVGDTVALVDKVVVIPKVKPIKHVEEHHKKPQKTVIQLSKKSKPTQQIAKIPNKKTTAKVSTKLYTIQVVSTDDIRDIERIRKNNKLLNSKSAKLIRKGNWYVLTLGEYESNAQAEQDIRNLPVSLAKLNPWVRPIASLG